MWCGSCQAEVAAEVTADERLVRCASCGATLDTPAATRASNRTREARELLERWSSGTLFDPFGPLIPSKASTQSDLASSSIAANSPVAAAEQVRDVPVSETELSTAENPPEPAPANPTGIPPTVTRRFRLDASHQQPGDRPQIPAALAISVQSRSSAQEQTPVEASNSVENAESALVAANTLGEPSPAGDISETPAESTIADKEPSTVSELREADPTAARRRTPRAETSRKSSRRRVRLDAAATPRREPVRAPRYRASVRTSDSEPEEDRSVHRPAAPRPPVSFSKGNSRRFDSETVNVPAPHFAIKTYVENETPRRGTSTSLAGQLLAYSGVLALTIGTAMVVWGYFGGPEHFAPTGWLITTAGQMLLFLGVVTLVSGGMEQTTDEVSRRIDSLGDRLIRIEQASRDHALRGPSIPAERFAAGYDATRAEARDRQRAS